MIVTPIGGNMPFESRRYMIDNARSSMIMAEYHEYDFYLWATVEPG